MNLKHKGELLYARPISGRCVRYTFLCLRLPMLYTLQTKQIKILLHKTNQINKSRHSSLIPKLLST